MDAKVSRAPARYACALGLLAIAIGGCTADGRPLGPLFRPLAAGDAAGTSESVALADALAADGWVLAVAPPGGTPPAYRWRNAALEAAARRQANGQSELTALLASSNPVVAANAAVVLARGAGQKATEQINQGLARAVRNDRLKPAQRAAAAESLRSRDAARLALVRELADEYGKFAANDVATYQPAIHAALLSSLAAQTSVDAEPRLSAALASPAAEVKVEALRAWSSSQAATLPAAAVELRNDPSPLVRGEALRAIAAHRQPGAHELLRRGLDDTDLSVRLAAIAALGELGSDEAKATLATLRTSGSDVARTAAVAALGALGADAEVLEAAADRSARVRQAVADTLAAIPGEARAIKQHTKALARDLVRDANAQVQQRAVAALAEWPLAEAGPVLLAALADGSYATRKAAAAQLASRWPAAAAFPVDGSPADRQAALAELNRQWTAQYGSLSDVALAALQQRVAQAYGITPEQLAQIELLVKRLSDRRLPGEVRKQVLAGLTAYGPELLVGLEQLARDKNLPPEVYADLLPGLYPVFADLNRLTSKDVLERRAAAEAILAQASKGPLSDLALRRLAEVASLENDALVWQNVLSATAADARTAAVQLAYAAIGNASAEVRRRAAEYLAAHADPQHVQALLPALQDPNVAVVIAAARALGAIGQMDDPRPLIDLLAVSDKLVRLEAALSLARMQLSEGRVAIERLARETDDQLRRRLATALGELNDPLLLPTLMLLLNDRSDVQRAALASLALVAGRDVGRGDDGSAPSQAEQVRRWQEWYRKQQGTSLR